MPNFRLIRTRIMKFLFRRNFHNVKLHGWPVQLVIKALPVFLLMILFTTIANQVVVPGPSINCRYVNRSETFRPRLYTPIKKHRAPTQRPPVLNQACQLHDISMIKESVKGIAQFNKRKPTRGQNKDVVHLRYYKDINKFLVLLLVVSVITPCFGKVRSVRGIFNIMYPTPIFGQSAQLRMREVIFNYLDTTGRHKRFLVDYSLTKFFALLTVFLQWLLSREFFGKQFTYYPIKTLLFFLNPNYFERQYPNPMRSLFPIISRCDSLFFNGTGYFDSVVVKCSFPLNALNQWTFLLLWIVIVFLMLINLISCLLYLSNLIPYIRIFRYKMLICFACPEMIRRARTYEEFDNDGNMVTKKVCHFSVIYVKLDFDDFVVLEVIRKNMKHMGKEKEFLVALVTTKNRMIGIKPVQPDGPPIVIRHAGRQVHFDLCTIRPNNMYLDHEDAIGALPDEEYLTIL